MRSENEKKTTFLCVFVFMFMDYSQFIGFVQREMLAMKEKINDGSPITNGHKEFRSNEWNSKSFHCVHSLQLSKSIIFASFDAGEVRWISLLPTQLSENRIMWRTNLWGQGKSDQEKYFILSFSLYWWWLLLLLFAIVVCQFIQCSNWLRFHICKWWYYCIRHVFDSSRQCYYGNE